MSEYVKEKINCLRNPRAIARDSNSRQAERALNSNRSQFGTEPPLFSSSSYGRQPHAPLTRRLPRRENGSGGCNISVGPFFRLRVRPDSFPNQDSSFQMIRGPVPHPALRLCLTRHALHSVLSATVGERVRRNTGSNNKRSRSNPRI